MNNCPKCGNPLQIGINECPICGTNINTNTNNSINQAVQTPVTPVAPVSAPLQNINPTVLQNNIPQPTMTNGTNISTPTPVVQPNPVVNATPVPPAGISPNTVSMSTQPGVKPVTNQTPSQIVSKPSETSDTLKKESIAEQNKKTPEPEILDEKIEKTAKDSKKKFKFDKKILAILGGVAAVLIIVASGFMIYNNKQNTLDKTTSKDKSSSKNVATTPTTTQNKTNGFTYELPNGWDSKSENNEVKITNQGQDVVLSISKAQGNITSINEESLKASAETQGMFSEINVSTIEVNDKKAYLIDASYNDYLIQYYYLDGENNNVIIASAIYETNDVKANNSSTVQQIIKSITYTETVKAIDPTGIYTPFFQIGSTIISNSQANTSNASTPTETDTTVNQETQNQTTVTPNQAQ